MIFISHNYKDKDFVGAIASELKDTYGEDKVFFDSWSIRPGENIIEKMNHGLEKCEYFFFFMTENSLNSEMVSLEWTSVLKEKSKRKIEFIPIKCDDSNIPMIISSLNYLDMFSDGIEVVQTQMKEIIEESYKESKFPVFNNLEAYALERDKYSVSIFIVAKRFFEPSSKFLIATNLSDDEIDISFPNKTFYYKAFNPESGTFKGRTLNTFTVSIEGGIKKGFKLEILVKQKGGNIDFLDLNHIKSEKEFPKIPIKIVKDISEIEV